LVRSVALVTTITGLEHSIVVAKRIYQQYMEFGMELRIIVDRVFLYGVDVELVDDYFFM
jgi:hypothetical protein